MEILQCFFHEPIAILSLERVLHTHTQETYSHPPSPSVSTSELILSHNKAHFSFLPHVLHLQGTDKMEQTDKLRYQQLSSGDGEIWAGKELIGSCEEGQENKESTIRDQHLG